VDGIAIDRGYWANTLHQIARRTRNHQDAEDMLHTAYLKVRQYAQDHHIDCVGGFLTKVAVNTWTDERRRDAFLQNHKFEAGYYFDCPEPLQDQVLEDRARLGRLKAGLEKMSPRTRDIFLLHRISELKQKDIAALLKISVSAVEKHIARAFEFLKKWMLGW
jgi:RNA polymerase sigma-70 factor (ECF subfamily)